MALLERYDKLLRQFSYLLVGLAIWSLKGLEGFSQRPPDVAGGAFAAASALISGALAACVWRGTSGAVHVSAALAGLCVLQAAGGLLGLKIGIPDADTGWSRLVVFGMVLILAAYVGRLDRKLRQ